MAFQVPGVISRRIVHRRNPKDGIESTNPTPVTQCVIASATAVGSVLTLTFEQPVNLISTPGLTTNVVGATPVSAVKTAPNVVAITFSAAIAAATSINISFRDAGIRNASGGFVVSNTFPV